MGKRIIELGGKSRLTASTQVSDFKVVKYELQRAFGRIAGYFEHGMVRNQAVHHRGLGVRMTFALLFLPVHPRAFSSNDGDMVMKQGGESAANGKPLNRDQGRTGFLSLKNDAVSDTTGREVVNLESSKAYVCRSRVAQLAADHALGKWPVMMQQQRRRKDEHKQHGCGDPESFSDPGFWQKQAHNVCRSTNDLSFRLIHRTGCCCPSALIDLHCSRE